MASALTLVTACERDRELPSAEPRTSTTSAAPPSSTGPATTPPTSTTVATSVDTVPATSAVVSAPPSSAASTLPPRTIDPIAGLSEFFGGQTLEFGSIGRYEALEVLETTVEDTLRPTRCIVIRRDAEHSWFRCIDIGIADGFVIVDGADPWWVDVGPELGQVAMTKQPPTWTLFSNGCTDSVAQIVGAGTLTASGTYTSLGCGGSSAVLSDNAGAPGPFDGGGTLAVLGPEGWNGYGGGSSMLCPYPIDGADPCTDLGSPTDLLEAALPIPPPSVLPPQDMVVNLLDLTVEADAMAFGATDVANAADLVVASVTSFDAEVPPVATVWQSGTVALVVVDVPAADDSIRSTTWAVWLDVPPDGSPPSVRRGYVWTNCARGVSGGLCV